MGLGKKFKRFTGAIGQATGQLTGSKAIGRGVAMATGAALGGLAGGVPGAITGSMGGNAGYSDIGKEITGTKNAIAQAEMQAQQTEALNAKVAEASRQRLITEDDLKRQEEELKKRTTFAGASMQSINERRKLLGA
jgi:hypothetical protein